MVHVLDEKCIPPFDIDIYGQRGTRFQTWFLLGSFLALLKKGLCRHKFSKIPPLHVRHIWGAGVNQNLKSTEPKERFVTCSDTLVDKKDWSS